MELALIAFAALVGSTLTLFSGFGLGTMMTPVFALFFPVPLAIAATAVVHLASNLFKLGLLARAADWRVVLRFGLPAALAALVGAAALGAVDRLPALGHYLLAGTRYEITPIKALIGALIVVFALLELSPRFQALAFPPRWLPLGGAGRGAGVAGGRRHAQRFSRRLRRQTADAQGHPERRAALGRRRHVHDRFRADAGVALGPRRALVCARRDGRVERLLRGLA